jgi:hypothetical protein
MHVLSIMIGQLFAAFGTQGTITLDKVTKDFECGGKGRVLVGLATICESPNPFANRSCNSWAVPSLIERDERPSAPPILIKSGEHYTSAL